MKKYKLKKEAIQFFKEDLATKVYPKDIWDNLSVDLNALTEVKEPFISYGKKTGKESSSLCGWSPESGARYEFTINFPSLTFHEHDVFSKGRITRELMNSIQDAVSEYYENFLEK